MKTIYLVNKVYTYTDDPMTRYHYAYDNKKKAKRKFEELKEEIVNDLIDYHSVKSLEELIEEENINLTDDSPSFFGYISYDGTEELELSIDEVTLE